MKKQNIYLITHTATRTNIAADIRILFKDGIIDFIKSGKIKTIRYGSEGSYTSLLKDMSLKEFEEEFIDAGFTRKQVTDNFRKSVSEVHGLHFEQNNLKKLPSKEIVRGGIYKTANGQLSCYIGKVHRVVINKKNYEKDFVMEDVEGHGYINMYSLKETLEDYQIRCCQVLKSHRSFVEKVGEIDIDTSDVLHTSERGSIYSSSKTTEVLTLKFL